MSTTPATSTPPDAADLFARRTIDNFCNALVKFGGKKMQILLQTNGFKLPAAEFAAALRTFAQEFSGQPEAPLAPVDLGGWFANTHVSATKEDPIPKPAPPAVLTAQIESDFDGVSLSPDRILDAVGTRKVRLNQLAAELNVEPAILGALISSPNSGLAVVGAGWVQVTPTA